MKFSQIVFSQSFLCFVAWVEADKTNRSLQHLLHHSTQCHVATKGNSSRFKLQLESVFIDAILRSTALKLAAMKKKSFGIIVSHTSAFNEKESLKSHLFLSQHLNKVL
jgi:hypothetical protein